MQNVKDNNRYWLNSWIKDLLDHLKAWKSNQQPNLSVPTLIVRAIQHADKEWKLDPTKTSDVKANASYSELLLIFLIHVFLLIRSSL
jgi:hypothetical protein